MDTNVFTFYYILWRCVNIANVNKKSDDLLINDQIKVPELMVIGPHGEQMGTKKLEDALTIANFAGLDLVLMNSGSDRPVAKIMDYNKYKYEKIKKQKETLKRQRDNNKEVKEYRLTYKMDVGDFETRRRNAQNYLEKGHKIKVTMRFKGREMTHVDIGQDVMIRFADALKEVAEIESEPKLEGRTMIMVLSPKKEV